MGTLENIISVAVLPRLPAKIINRFKCVSKFFKTTISSSEFARLYLRYHTRSSGTNNFLILPDYHNFIYYDLNSDSPSTAISTSFWTEGLVSIVGSCNGVLCIRVDLLEYVYVCILNPFTDVFQYIYIPVFREDIHYLGFAFDHENLDYKIVVASDQNRYSCRGYETRVYSMNTSSWTTVVKTGFTSMKGRRDGVLIDGYLLHWIFWNSSMKGRIGCFDVCKMNWVDDVLLPRYYYDPDNRKGLLELGVFDGHLFSSFHNLDDSHFDVWVMKKYGVQDAWFMLLSINVSNDLLGGVVPIARQRESSEVLIRQRHSSRLFWYNSRNGGIRDAKFDGAPDFSRHQVYMSSKSFADPPSQVVNLF